MTDAETWVGPYRLVRELGRGATGVVHLALDPTGREVAVKRMIGLDARTSERAMREASVRMRHPNVIEVLGAGLDAEGQTYIVMERLEGATLSQHMSAGVPLATFLRWMADAAAGVAALHARGIVHRDVKPSNVFVTRDGQVKVLDFGAAAYLEAATLLTMSGAVIGTPAYLSPEQARGARVVDARADVWALGIMLFEGIVGTRPFARGSALGNMLAAVSEPTPAMGLADAAELEELVHACLAKSASERPTAAALAARLRALPPPSRASAPPALPLAAASTWRRIALLVLDEVNDRDALARQVELAGAALLPILWRSAVVVLGHESSRGDELLRAVRLALAVEPLAGHVAVTSARLRPADQTLDPSALAECERFLGTPEPGVLVSETVAAQLGRLVDTREVGPGVRRVLGLAEAPPSTLLHGRDAELDRLGRLAAQVARERQARSLLCIGPPGIGKTALVRGWIARDPSLRAVVAVATPERSEPLAPFLDALAIARVAETDPQRALDKRRVKVLDAIAAELEASAELLVLALEDAQWSDPASLALLRELPDLFAGRPLAIVVTAREAIALPDVEELLTLAPLGAAAVRALAERDLGRPVSGALASELAERSGGNPLYVEQLLRLGPTEGTGSTEGRPALPATIESAVQAQIDLLPATLRETVLRLAVMGAVCDAADVRRVLGRSGESWVAHLVELGILERRFVHGRALVAFRSRVVAEVAYGTFDPEGAAHLHREVAARLSEEPVTDAEAVVRHALAGGDAALAGRFARIASAEAARIGHGAAVLRLLPTALEGASREETYALTWRAAEAAAFAEGAGRHRELLEKALAAASGEAERARVEVELAERLRREGRVAEAERHLSRALAAPLDASSRARVACRVALARGAEGRAAEALALLPSGGESLDAATEALVWDTRGYLHGAVGALGDRRRAYARAAERYEAAGDLRRAAGALSNLGDSMLRIGALEDAERTLRSAVEAARRVGNALTEAYARANLGVALAWLGREREARRTLESAEALAARLGEARLGVVARVYRSRVDPAIDLRALERALEGREGDPTLRMLVGARLLEIAPDAARIAAAEALVSHAHEVEEGALDLCEALAAASPASRAVEIGHALLDTTYRALAGDPAWRDELERHVRAHYPSVARQWSPPDAGGRVSAPED
ncbi:MAG: protein kinase [Sandaracinus sp.]